MSQPLRSLHQTSGGDTLLVLLPGAYMTPEHYAEHCFPAVAARRPGCSSPPPAS